MEDMNEWIVVRIPHGPGSVLYQALPVLNVANFERERGGIIVEDRNAATKNDMAVIFRGSEPRAAAVAYEGNLRRWRIADAAAWFPQGDIRELRDE